jgi:hypothetical protein
MAVEQAGPVAAGYFQEVVDAIGQVAGARAVSAQGATQAIEPPGHRGRRQRLGVVQDVRGPVHPAESSLDVRPRFCQVSRQPTRCSGSSTSMRYQPLWF